MEIKEISQKSTKKEIWDAYIAILEELQKKKGEEGEEKEGAIPPLSTQKEKELLQEVDELNVEKVSQDISNLKITIQATLNKLADKLVEELRKLESVKQVVKTENSNLENIYKIKNEADVLLNLIEVQEQKRAEFRKKLEEEEEGMRIEIERKRKEWKREIEEYEYSLKMMRKKDQDEYGFQKTIKEREFNEKMGLREKELKVRESALLEKENELKSLKTQVEAFPKELEKQIHEATEKTKEDIERQAKIKNELIEKEIAKEREVAKLRIVSLEDIIKRQASQINTLENQLAVATQKAQELAVKIIEAGGEREKKRQLGEGEMSGKN